jgi:hypothetical protein
MADASHQAIMIWKNAENSDKPVQLASLVKLSTSIPN